MNTRTENVINKIKRIQELRRSNAATPMKSKKLYSRKRKHKNRDQDPM